jgi:PadR family transcriptional regulator AphA
VRGPLTSFSYVILTLVGRGGASAHDIVQMMRRGRAFWTAAESHYYAEPKRLAKLGYLAVETAPGKTTQRRVYSLTPLGEEALRAWLAQPSEFPRIQNEAVVRVLAAEFTDPASVVASLLAMRADLDAVETDLEGTLEGASSLPEREQSIRLVADLGLRLVQAHRDWLTLVESELTGNARNR